MSRTFVIGDIHGACKALAQCLDRAKFNPKIDHLICLGDVCDGWPETKQSITLLMTIKHLTYILGNHDLWAMEWMTNNQQESLWLEQGGSATIQSYNDKKVPKKHIRFFERARLYYILNNKLFVHAGIIPNLPLEKHAMDIFLWDRSLAQNVQTLYLNNQTEKISTFEEIYIGHTPVSYGHPIQGGEVWMMDTGAGWNGVLSMMDIQSKDVYVSDKVPSLYPDAPGRTGRFSKN